MAKHIVEIQYTEDKLKAELDCPLCGKHWIFPFSAREIFRKPYPKPSTLMWLHLYGCGSEERYCSGFDSSKTSVEDITDKTVAVSH
jgi:hypothetical protein